MTGSLVRRFTGKRVRLVVGDFEPVSGKLARVENEVMEFVPDSDVFGPDTTGRTVYVASELVSVLVPMG